MNTPALPDDIIIAIATQIKRQSPSPAALSAFSLASKRFHTLSKKILYGNIYLNPATSIPFVDHFVPSKYGHYICSISLCLQRSPTFGTLPVFAIASSIAGQISRLIPIIRQLANLTSFSLMVEPTAGIDLPRATIIAFLDALPESCVNLEIDAPKYHPDQDIEEYAKIHMCGSVRRVLPRMQHVRLRLGAMCSEMFEPEHQDGTSAPEPISMPNLKTLVINCALGGRGIEGCIENNRITGTSYHHGSHHKALYSIAPALTNFITQHSEILKDATIILFHEAQKSIDLRWACTTALRVDMITKECWALPFFYVGGPFQQTARQLLRLPNDVEIVLSPEDIEPVAEGRPWKDVVGGGRLPAEILNDEQMGRPSFATGCAELPLQYISMEQWLEQNSADRMWVCWRNEQTVGRKLMLPERRTGIDYLSAHPVVEEVPAGWVRTRQLTLEKVS